MALFTRYNLYKVVTPFLRASIPASLVKSLLKKTLQKHRIRYLEMGGAVPVEGYLVVHLSPVEIYAIPRARKKTIFYEYDEASDRFKNKILSIQHAITLNYDISNGIPVADQTFDGINMSHFLEHFSRDSGLAILKECYRILKPGGTLRISCPNLRTYAEAYIKQDMKFFRAPVIDRFCNYEGLLTPGDLFINKAYDNQNGHKWFYDAESAMQLARDAGFRSTSEKSLHDSRLPEINIIEPAYRQMESFYVEAYR